MATILHHPGALPPIPAVTRILGQFHREQLAGFIQVAIELLDMLEGDPEAEDNGDKDDGSFQAEDEFMLHTSDGIPGCPIADPGEADEEDCGHDEGEPDFRRRKWSRAYGPGCEISDPDKGAEEDGELEYHR